MMNLELSDKQRTALADMLDTSLSALHDEISHTDTREYREMLRERQDVLTEIRTRLH